MSANTSIKEGGAPRSFGPVAALLVQGDEGKYFLWVPESERQLDTLSVDKNGIYQAKKLGVYGWRSVSVNVPTSGSVTGKDPETGQEVTVTTDPDTGEIVKTVVPVEIKVITPPTNPYGVYVDGQTISTDGMVVKAYDAEGNEMMTVPLGQITINPTVAVFDESKDTGGETSVSTDLDIAPFPNPILCSASYTWDNGYGGKVRRTSDGALATGIQAGDMVYIVFASKSRKYHITITYQSGAVVEQDAIFGGTVTIDGKTAYYSYDSGLASRFEDLAISQSLGGSITDTVRERVAWSMMYGNAEQLPHGSPQTITVSWPRPGDGAILETTFDILVGPRGGGGED